MFFATLPTDDGLIYPLHFPRVLLSQLSSEIMPLEEKAVFPPPAALQTRPNLREPCVPVDSPVFCVSAQGGVSYWCIIVVEEECVEMSIGQNCVVLVELESIVAACEQVCVLRLPSLHRVRRSRAIPAHEIVHRGRVRWGLPVIGQNQPHLREWVFPQRRLSLRRQHKQREKYRQGTANGAPALKYMSR